MKVDAIEQATAKVQSKSGKKLPSKNGVTSQQRPVDMECHVCACPLFQPRPTCAFCQQGACTDHLRKKRKFPLDVQQPQLDRKKSDGKRPLMDICDTCEDSYLFGLVTKQEDVAAGIRTNEDLAKLLDEVEKLETDKASETTSRLQAKEIKYSKLSSQKERGAAEVWEKSQEAHQTQENISKQEQQLDQLTELVNAATVELDQMEAQPFVSLEDDVKLLETENAKLTRELLKLDKSLSDVQNGMRKLEAELVTAYDNWQKGELAKKERAASGKQEKCVIF